MTRLGRRTVFSISGGLLALGMAGFGLSFQLHPLSSEPFNNNNNNNSSSNSNNNNSLTLSDTLAEGEDSLYSPILDWLPAIFLCFSGFSFCFGLGPIPWAYSNELMPADVRATLHSFNSCLMPLECFLVAKILPSVMTQLSLPVTFYVFASFSLLALLWGVFVLPETRGLTSQVGRANWKISLHFSEIFQEISELFNPALGKMGSDKEADKMITITSENCQTL